MKYSFYDNDRYMPTMTEAIQYGERTLDAISFFFDRTNVSQYVLEIGCASGSFLKALQQHGFENIKGIDVDGEMIAHGRNNLSVIIEDIDWKTYVSLIGDNYDVIVALDVFEHISPNDIQEVLDNTFQRLKHNGKLILRMPNPICPFVLPTYYGDTTHKLLATPELIHYMLKTAGFTSVTFQETKPHNIMKKIAYFVVHYLVVRPLVSLFYYHFYGEMPSVITRNVYCCAIRKNER